MVAHPEKMEMGQRDNTDTQSVGLTREDYLRHLMAADIERSFVAICA